MAVTWRPPVVVKSGSKRWLPAHPVVAQQQVCVVAQQQVCVRVPPLRQMHWKPRRMLPTMGQPPHGE